MKKQNFIHTVVSSAVNHDTLVARYGSCTRLEFIVGKSREYVYVWADRRKDSIHINFKTNSSATNLFNLANCTEADIKLHIDLINEAIAKTGVEGVTAVAYPARPSRIDGWSNKNTPKYRIQFISKDYPWGK